MKRPIRKSKAAPSPAANACREIIHADAAGIRKKIRSQYERVIEDTRKANSEIEVFRGTDEPEYSKWYHATFGALLTELRELETKRYQLSIIYEEVWRINLLYHHRSMAQSYRMYLEWQKEDEEAAARAGGSGTSADRDDPEEIDPDEDPFAKAFKNAFKNMFGFDPDEMPEAEEFSDWDRRDRKDRQLPRNQREGEETTGRVKQIYRLLVRKLHPDSAENSNPEQLELWHKAQQAYENDDIQALEAILATCEIREKGTHLQASMSTLLQVINQLRKSLNSIRAQLRQYRKHPGWQFSAQPAEKKIVHKKELQGEMRRNLSRLKDDIQNFESEIESWKNTPGSRKRDKRKKMGQQEFWD